MKRFICGAVCGAVLTTAIGAGAAGVWKTIDVLENDITVMVDGQQLTESNFLYNDTTYLPLRAVAEAVGKPVEYDATTNTAYIGVKPGGFILAVSYDPAPFTLIERDAITGEISKTIRIESIEFPSALTSDESDTSAMSDMMNLKYIVSGRMSGGSDADFKILCYDKDGYLIDEERAFVAAKDGELFRSEGYILCPKKTAKVKCVSLTD